MPSLQLIPAVPCATPIGRLSAQSPTPEHRGDAPESVLVTLGQSNRRVLYSQRDLPEKFSDCSVPDPRFCRGGPRFRCESSSAGSFMAVAHHPTPPLERPS